MASSKARNAEVGLQTAHGTPVAPTVRVPMGWTDEDQREVHVAAYGGWTPTAVTTEIATMAGLEVDGPAFFELLPIFFNSGIDDVAPTGADPYTHTYAISPSAVGAPMPLTWKVGATGVDIGGTGPAVQLADMYVEEITLSGNINDKVVNCKVKMFGTEWDDNSGAGYAFEGVDFVSTQEMLSAILGQLNIQDAETTGGNFLTMTPFSCAVLDWEWTLTTGIGPLWCTTDNTTSFVGLKYTEPMCTFKPVMRTSATNYALVKAKHTARTPQELQLIVNGTATRAFTANMTGRWTECPTVHGDTDGELTMSPTFTCEVPAMQTTWPHFLGVIVVSKYNWT